MRSASGASARETVARRALLLSTLARGRAPAGSRARQSVKVPPVSVQICQGAGPSAPTGRSPHGCGSGPLPPPRSPLPAPRRTRARRFRRPRRGDIGRLAGGGGVNGRPKPASPPVAALTVAADARRPRRGKYAPGPGRIHRDGSVVFGRCRPRAARVGPLGVDGNAGVDERLLLVADGIFPRLGGPARAVLSLRRAARGAASRPHGRR